MTDIARLTAALSGSYRIEREIGAGGMATVYLAHDIKHERDVAIKVLHPELGAALGGERFLSEIKTTARLQHPHILPLLDSGDAAGLLYYVMPLVTGETLRARLTREKQLPIGAALTIAREVADALGYAHANGVIHRDIKPENILLQGGHALVADFGIALAVQSAGAGRMTQTGLSLGTPQYMSPEQAMGEKTIDARSDIYALGAVTYEMLTGEPPFTGPTVQAIVAKVLSSEAEPLTTIRKSVPGHVADAVHTAIEKLPADRFATAGEFVLALASEGGNRRVQRATPTLSSGNRLAVPVLSVLCIILATLALWGWRRPRESAVTTRAFLRFPAEEAPLNARPSQVIVSDGSAIVYVGKSGTTSQLWMRKRSELHASPISGTAGATNVFVSPDGAWIGFAANGKVLKVPSAGGAPVTVGMAPCSGSACSTVENGTFLDDGRVVYNYRNGIVISRADGGLGDSLVTSAMVKGFSAVQPSVLPESKGVLFAACTLYCNRSDVWVVDLATRKARKLLDFASHPTYVSTGHMLYVDAKGSVFAVPFNTSTMELSGTPVLVLDHTVGDLSVSRNGTLLYADGDGSPRSQLMLVGRDGTALPVDTSWRGNFSSVALSPDGSRIATTIVQANGEEHVWVKPLAGGVPARLSFGTGQHTSPAWSADGRTIFYSRFTVDSNWFMSRPADGSGSETVVQHSANWVIESVFSRDGTWRIQREFRPDGSRDVFAQKLSGDTTMRTVAATRLGMFSPTLSPDNRWLAYASEEGNGFEVWAVPFPDGKGIKWQVSASGGAEPLWSRDARALFYVSPSDSLIAVSIGGTTSLSAGAHQTLFSLAPYRRFVSHRAYDVRPGNAGFVMIRDGSPSSTDLVLVDNWFAELRAKLQQHR